MGGAMLSEAEIRAIAREIPREIRRMEEEEFTSFMKLVLFLITCYLIYKYIYYISIVVLVIVSIIFLCGMYMKLLDKIKKIK